MASVSSDGGDEFMEELLTAIAEAYDWPDYQQDARAEAEKQRVE
jgi:hypothetical protein